MKRRIFAILLSLCLLVGLLPTAVFAEDGDPASTSSGEEGETGTPDSSGETEETTAPPLRQTNRLSLNPNRSASSKSSAAQPLSSARLPRARAILPISGMRSRLRTKVNGPYGSINGGI